MTIHQAVEPRPAPPAGKRSPAIGAEVACVAVLLDAGPIRRWVHDLVDSLSREPMLSVSVHAVGARPPVLGRLDLLQEIERIAYRRRPAASAIVAASHPSDPGAVTVSEKTLVLDLRSGPVGDASAVRATDGVRVVAPVFDGHRGEEQLAACLLSGGVPRVDLVDLGTGLSLWSGRPSVEAARSFTDALDAVYARTATMLRALISAPRPGGPVRDGGRSLLSGRLIARHVAGRLAGLTARALYHLCCRAPHWRVGWRQNEGPGVAERLDLSGPAWRTLADPGTRFFADPFPFVRDRRRHVFLEDLDHRTGKGIISVVEIGPSGPIGAPLPVLEEPWHLSYPLLIEHAGEIWMIPESSQAGAVYAYRADPYPRRWVREATLIEGVALSDATIVAHGGRWYMFATAYDGAGAHSDVLTIHHAPDLLGPWVRHSKDPVLVDAAMARPAGHLVRGSSGLLRPVQDCVGGYGRALGIAAVTRLDEEGFEEKLLARIEPGPSWTGRRLHTLNRHGDLECIDGSAISVRGLGTVIHR